MVADHLFEDIPHLFVLALQHLLGAFDRVGVAQILEPANDERLEQFQRDLLGQAALVQPQVRADDDHAAGRVVDALAEQVLAEAALLALDHVGQRLERAIARAEHRALAAVVVEQRVDRLLQHPLFVADDHFGRVEIDQLLQPVVAVDDAAIEVVQVAGGEIARVEQHQRTQVGRNDRDHVQHHPLGLVVAVADGLDDLQPIDQILGFLLRAGLDQLDAQILGELHQVQILEQLADRFGPHVGLEGAVAIGFAGRAVFFFGQQLLLLERRVAGLGDDVILEVDHLFQAGGLHGQQVAQAAGHGLEEPDVDDRRGQFDVAHPLAADAAVRHLDAAAVADHALVFHAAVLAAGAFPVLFRAEDALAEQTVFFRPVGAVVDRFRLLHLAERPTANIVRSGEADLDRCVIVDPIVGAFASTHCSTSVSERGRTNRT